MESPEENKTLEVRKRGRSAVFGIAVLLFGFLLLLRNTEIITRDIFHYFFNWEMLLIIIGAYNLFDHKRWFGFLLLGIGSLFLIARIFGALIGLGEVFWPLVFILGGFFLIFGSARFAKHRQQSIGIAKDDDFLDDVAVFGGIKRTVNSQNFKGGRVTAIFGGSEINLRNAVLSPENNVIEMTCLFGGSSLVVPTDWNVKLEVVSIFGGFSDKRPPMPVDNSKTLIVKGIALFGGGELKSY